MSNTEPWIGYDLDGTLIELALDWPLDRIIGKPIKKMVDRLKADLAEGKKVKIFTARVGGIFSPFATDDERAFAREQYILVHDWCLDVLGQDLEVTAVKDMSMICLYDDRAVGVVTNTGELLHEAEYERAQEESYWANHDSYGGSCDHCGG